MRRALCETLPLHPGSLVSLDEAESKHLSSVLRMGPGDEVELLDGKGYKAKAELVFKNKKVFANTTEAPSTDARFISVPIHLTVGIIKGEAMEWLVEKAVELGVRSFTPMEAEFSVIKIHKRGAETFQDRWQRIADQAIKQCGRLDRLKINTPILFEEALQNEHHFIWLNETLAETGNREDHLSQVLRQLEARGEYTLLVGPEGGFSPSERARLSHLVASGKHAITQAGLGSIVLRAETAALMGLSILIGDYYGKK